MSQCMHIQISTHKIQWVMYTLFSGKHVWHQKIFTISVFCQWNICVQFSTLSISHIYLYEQYHLTHQWVIVYTLFCEHTWISYNNSHIDIEIICTASQNSVINNTHVQFSTRFHMSASINNICELYNTFCYLGQYSGRGRRDEISVLPLLLKLHRPTLLRALHSCGLTMVDPCQQLQSSLIRSSVGDDWRWVGDCQTLMSFSKDSS